MITLLSVLKFIFVEMFFPAILPSFVIGTLVFIIIYISLKNEQRKEEKRDFIMQFLR